MDASFQQQLKQRFAQLPQSIQAAITSADMEAHLRALADTHQLHVDQWEKLENEVQLTLLGLERAEDLQINLKKNVGVTDELAAALAADISAVVFAPIRGELERILSHPDAQQKEVSDVETARAQTLAAEGDPTTPAPEQKALRAELSPSYAASSPSHERKTVAGDPYREQL